MRLEPTVRAIAGRLSLREPQAESLRRLADALETVPALRDHRARNPADLAAIVQALKGRFPGLANHAKAIANNIHAQMAFNYFEEPGESEVIVSQGFTPIKPGAVTAEGNVISLHQAPDDKSQIATLVYGGFTKCTYTYQKFQSDSERVFAVILERDALTWMRPAAGQFNIFYRRGPDQPEYVPDFVAATTDVNLLIEIKKVADMQSEEVIAKAHAAAAWCAHASAYAATTGSKSWKYLLVPHDAVVINATLAALAGAHCFRKGLR